MQAHCGDQTTAMLCSSGSKALTLVSLVLLVRHPRVKSLIAIRIESNAANDMKLPFPDFLLPAVPWHGLKTTLASVQ